MGNYRNKNHMSFMHDFTCCLKKYDRKQCSSFGSVAVHHLMRPWDGEARGMSIKSSDRNCIPLCWKHHQALHQHGDEKEFFKNITGNEEFGTEIAQCYWRISPHNED